MRYQFDDVQLRDVTISLQGVAEFDRDPREKHAYELADIRLTGIPREVALDGYHAGDTLDMQALRVCLRNLIREDLKARHHQAICDQWDDEAPDRREAAQWDAHEARIDSYEGV
jgi:hypothetical protein